MKKLNFVFSFLCGIFLLNWTNHSVECLAEQGGQRDSKEQVVLNQEEMNLIQNLDLLENLEYLEDEDVDLFANYDAIEEDADDTQNNK